MPGVTEKKWKSLQQDSHYSDWDFNWPPSTYNSTVFQLEPKLLRTKTDWKCSRKNNLNAPRTHTFPYYDLRHYCTQTWAFPNIPPNWHHWQRQKLLLLYKQWFGLCLSRESRCGQEAIRLWRRWILTGEQTVGQGHVWTAIHFLQNQKLVHIYMIYKSTPTCFGT
jgi:hypothetical protein